MHFKVGDVIKLFLPKITNVTWHHYIVVDIISESNTYVLLQHKVGTMMMVAIKEKGQCHWHYILKNLLFFYNIARNQKDSAIDLRQRFFLTDNFDFIVETYKSSLIPPINKEVVYKMKDDFNKYFDSTAEVIQGKDSPSKKYLQYDRYIDVDNLGNVIVLYAILPTKEKFKNF